MPYRASLALIFAVLAILAFAVAVVLIVVDEPLAKAIASIAVGLGLFAAAHIS